MPIIFITYSLAYLDRANYGFAAAAGNDKDVGITHGTSSGGVTVNRVMLHYAESRLPFGGVNGSGIERYKGNGFRELSNARSIFVQKAL